MENLVRVGKKLCLLGFTAISAAGFFNSVVMTPFLPIGQEIARLIFSPLVFGLIPALTLQWFAQKLAKVSVRYAHAYALTAGNLVLLYFAFKLPQIYQPGATATLIVETAAYVLVASALHAIFIKRADGTPIGFGRGLLLVASLALTVVLTIGLGLLLIAFCVVGGIGGQM